MGICTKTILCLLRTSSTAQSVKFPRSGSSWPTPMLHLLYVLLATARSSLKPQRELALENLALSHFAGAVGPAIRSASLNQND